MTTGAILALIDALLSKAPHSDGGEQVKLLLNELRERIVAENESVTVDADSIRLVNVRLNEELLREKELVAAYQRRWKLSSATSRTVWATHEKQFAEQEQRIQDQAAQLCAVRNAAGMQVGKIEELCQRIKTMREDAEAFVEYRKWAGL